LIFFAYLLAIPLAYLATLVMLTFKRDVRGVPLSLLFFALTILAGWWDITRSRSSTAGIGFLFLPLTAAVAGFGGLAFGRWRRSATGPQLVGAWIGLVCGVGVIAITLVEGRKTISRNRVRDDQQAEFSAEIARDRDEISAALQSSPGRQRAWLDSAIRARMDDRAFLLAALPNDSVSPEVLDTVASGRDLNTTLEAVRNPNTRAATLERVYRTASYPPYFFQALAAHRNTPPDIMRKLYTQRDISGLDIWFAGNPSTPKEVLRDIARKTRDPNVVTALLQNTALDCTTLTQLSVNLMKDQNRTADNRSVADLNARLPEVCKNAPLE
jgi:hypothetical protein